MTRECVCILLVACLLNAASAQDLAALEAQFQQGVKAEYGVGTQGADLAGAMRFYQQGAQHGYAPAMVRFAYMKHLGKGTSVDLPGALGLYAQAAQQGSKEGQYMHALCYATGVGTTRDPAKARALMLTPAEAGHQEAQYTLAVMMGLGDGGPKREAGARRWFDRAATGPDKELAAKAAAQRDKIDQNLFAASTEGRDILVALGMFILVAGAMGGGGDSGSSNAGSPSIGGGSGSTYPGPRDRTVTPANGDISRILHGENMLGIGRPVKTR
jgi:hypothetical protein